MNDVQMNLFDRADMVASKSLYTLNWTLSVWLAVVSLRMPVKLASIVGELPGMLDRLSLISGTGRFPAV